MDNHKQTMQKKFLSHFLVILKFPNGMRETPNFCLIMVWSVMGSNNTAGDSGIYPITDLKQLDRFKKGFNNPVAMADGYGFIWTIHLPPLHDCMWEAPNLRLIMVGSAMGNNNTIKDGDVYPIADLKQLDMFKKGFNNPVAMAEEYCFINTKAYK